MAKVYARMVRNGKMTLENVPEKWRRQVEKLLGEDE